MSMNMSNPLVCLIIYNNNNCKQSELFSAFNGPEFHYVYIKNEKHFFKLAKCRDAAVKRTATRGVGISSTRKSIYLLTTTPTSHTHTFHPLSTIVIHTFNLCKVQSMDDNCGEWVECMGVASGCGEQEVGVASGSGWNLWVWLLGVIIYNET